jgi:hypothetical protein
MSTILPPPPETDPDLPYDLDDEPDPWQTLHDTSLPSEPATWRPDGNA